MLIGITGFTDDGKTRLAHLLKMLAQMGGIRADVCSIAREAKAILAKNGVDKYSAAGRQALATYIEESYRLDGFECFVMRELSCVKYVLGDKTHLVIFDDVRRVGEERVLRSCGAEIWRAIGDGTASVADGEINSILHDRAVITDTSELNLLALAARELANFYEREQK